MSAARYATVLRRGFWISGVCNVVVVGPMGLFHRGYTGLNAMISTACGLLAGLALFPAPGAGTTTLLESFLLAALVPLGVSLVLLRLLPGRATYDCSLPGASVRRFRG